MRSIRVAMLLLPMAPLVLVIAILIDGLTDNVTEGDVGIVLGTKVMPDGTPSARLRARLDKADEEVSCPSASIGRTSPARRRTGSK